MKKIILILSFLLIANFAFADTQTENEELARINSVLNALYPMIDAAEAAAPANQRVTFRYDWLVKDIQAIQAGIAQKINQVPIEPRRVEPLQTQYVELTDKTDRK
jgi:RAQPRD family integrative conjugative element protein